MHFNIEQKQQIVSHIEKCFPEEACGLIGGKQDTVEIILPIENEYHSSNRFRMNGSAQIFAFSILESKNLNLIGIYHSHPIGQPFPSETDIEEFSYTNTLQLICTPYHHVSNEEIIREWQIKGFLINGKGFQEIVLDFE